MTNLEERIRENFGKEIKLYREKNKPKISQKVLCSKLKKHIGNDAKSKIINQRNISRIEHGNPSIILSTTVILALKEVCGLSDEVTDAYIKLLGNLPEIEDEQQIISIKEHGYLITDMSHEEFNAYTGKYFCYFHSTNSEQPKIIHGILTLSNENNIDSHCTAILEIYENSKPIKTYRGQFMLNLHYRTSYCFLVAQDKQEVCLLISNHFNSTIKKNLLNMSLVLTTSAGSQKRPTMHRMLFSRKELTEETLMLIHPQLKLNTDRITVSENEINSLKMECEKKLVEQPNSDTNKPYEVLLKCIEYIKHYCKKETYYSIDESIIYDSETITNNTDLRCFAISKLREHSIDNYYNKISDTIHNVCLNIINQQDD